MLFFFVAGALFAVNRIVNLKAHTGFLGHFFIEYIVFARQYGIEHNAGNGSHCQSRQFNGYAAQRDGLPCPRPRADTRMTAATMELRLLAKSTWFSTTLRTPIAEIMPYSTKEIPGR